ANHHRHDRLALVVVDMPRRAGLSPSAARGTRLGGLTSRRAVANASTERSGQEPCSRGSGLVTPDPGPLLAPSASPSARAADERRRCHGSWRRHVARPLPDLFWGSSVFPSEAEEAHTGFEPVPPP